jgi:hypothetical protein
MQRDLSFACIFLDASSSYPSLASADEISGGDEKFLKSWLHLLSEEIRWLIPRLLQNFGGGGGGGGVIGELVSY